MTTLQKVVSALSFAHLAGFGAVKPKAKGKSEDESTPDNNDDLDKKKGKSADGDEPDDDENKKGAKGAKVDDDDDPNADSDDSPNDTDKDGDPDNDAKKSKAKGKPDDEDDDDEEMRGKSSAAQARNRERARCAAIFASPAAAKNPVLAANLAFKSRMGRVEALAVLEGTPAGSMGGHAGHPSREARNPRVGAGMPDALSSSQAVAKGWDTAFAKVSPPARR